MLIYQLVRRIHETHTASYFYGRIQTRSNQAGDRARFNDGRGRQEARHCHQIVTDLGLRSLSVVNDSGRSPTSSIELSAASPPGWTERSRARSCASATPHESAHAAARPRRTMEDGRVNEALTRRDGSTRLRTRGTYSRATERRRMAYSTRSFTSAQIWWMSDPMVSSRWLFSLTGRQRRYSLFAAR